MFRNLIIVVAVVVSATAPALADLVAFTDRPMFDAAAPGPLSVLNFDSEATGTIPSGTTIDGIKFTYNFGGVSLAIADVFPTTSSPNFLGTDDADVLQDGDDIDFTFSARTGFGLYVISADLLIDGDIQLTVGATTASLLSSAVQDTLSDGSNVWFLGIQSDDASTFTSASLTTHGGGGAFLYNLDDVVSSNIAAVPEVSSFVLCFAVGGVWFVVRISGKILCVLVRRRSQ